MRTKASKESGRSALGVTGRRDAKRRGNSTQSDAMLLGAPVDALVMPLSPYHAVPSPTTIADR
jgi:hypothetical protein